VFARVIDARAVHTVPGRTSGAFLGLVNVDGELLLCCSTAQLLGLEWKTKPRRMFVAARDSERFVFAAEEVLGLRRPPRSEFKDPPVTISRAQSAFTTAIFDLDGRNVALIDEGRLFESAARSLQ
jgi:chemotaxis-related protein WspD